MSHTWESAMRDVDSHHMPVPRMFIFLLFASVHSIKINAQAISTISAKVIPILLDTAPTMKSAPKSDSLRNRLFTYRGDRIPLPLIVVDGKIITHKVFSVIDPQRIDNVLVVKGEEAIKMFGMSGINGVIVITMKK